MSLILSQKIVSDHSEVDTSRLHSVIEAQMGRQTIFSLCKNTIFLQQGSWHCERLVILQSSRSQFIHCLMLNKKNVSNQESHYTLIKTDYVSDASKVCIQWIVYPTKLQGLTLLTFIRQGLFPIVEKYSQNLDKCKQKWFIRDSQLAIVPGTNL